MSNQLNQAFPVTTESDTCVEERGLNKLEWMVGQVAAGWFADPTATIDSANIRSVVGLAQALLDECENRLKKSE